VATEVVLPMLGITVEKGKIVEWLKREGDSVQKGEIIFIVETDKVATEVESPASGILAKIVIPVNQEVPVLTVVGVITEPGEKLSETYEVAPAAEPAPAAALERPTAYALRETLPPPQPSGPARVMPAGRKLARDQGIDLSAVTGTGPDGVILLRDVRAAVSGAGMKASTLARRLAEKEGTPLAGIAGTGVRGRVMVSDVERAVADARSPDFGKVIPMDNIRRVIARRMSESAFTAPHIYFFADVAMDPLLGFRKQVSEDFEKKFGLRPSVNDFLIKAVALNILDFPIMNAQARGQEIHVQPEINVGLAVAMDNGLMVPAIAQADRAGLADIARQRMDLVRRARAGKLTADEMGRGTFTISSLAQYDIVCFTAILNPPQSGILSIGKTREELYLDKGEVKARTIATFGLSVDHRIIDGAVAADFLQNLKWKLERPAFTFLVQ